MACSKLSDDFYNLNQLAEVTVASGPIITSSLINKQQKNDLNKIKMYENFLIKNNNNNNNNLNYKTKKWKNMIIKKNNNNNNNNNCNNTVDYNDVNYIKKQRQCLFYYNNNNNNTTSTNNNILNKDIDEQINIDSNSINSSVIMTPENTSSSSSASSLSGGVSPSSSENDLPTNLLYKHNDNKSFLSTSGSSTPTTIKSYTINNSCDDDNATINYNYSHKIFDRTKLRKTLLKMDNESNFNEKKLINYNRNDLDIDIDVYNDENIDDEDDDEINKNDDKNLSSSGSVGDLSSGDDTHVCPECGKKYSTSSNLARHRQTHRSLQDKKARRCPQCDKVYVSMPAFSMHVRTHSQGCVCKECGKRFSRPWLLNGHIRTHTGEKPFKCSICNKAFADKSNLRAHVQTHSKIKPHSCKKCGKSFALKSYLSKHEESSCSKTNHSGKGRKNIHIGNNGKKLKQPRIKMIPNDNDGSIDEGIVSDTKPISEHHIIHEETTQKSYINLTDTIKQTHESISRISVIRSTTVLQQMPYNYDPVDKNMDFIPNLSPIGVSNTQANLSTGNINDLTNKNDYGYKQHYEYSINYINRQQQV